MRIIRTTKVPPNLWIPAIWSIITIILITWTWAPIFSVTNLSSSKRLKTTRKLGSKRSMTLLYTMNTCITWTWACDPTRPVKTTTRIFTKRITIFFTGWGARAIVNTTTRIFRFTINPTIITWPWTNFASLCHCTATRERTWFSTCISTIITWTWATDPIHTTTI